MPADVSAARLGIVIPVHNRRAYTRACLRSLAAQTRRDFRVIVVDDGSTDGTAEMVRREFPETTLVSGDGTLWWTAATNLGIAHAVRARAAYVLCLNDDTEPAADMVERLMETAARLPWALVGASAVDAATGRACFVGERANWLTAGARSLLGDAATAARRIVAVSHAPGRGLLIPAPVFERIGYFDALHFPQTAADYDFTHRARRAGYQVVCDRRAVLAMYPDACGDAVIRGQKSWANYRRHLFAIKGGGNLRVFFWYAVRNCPAPLLPVCLAAGWLRRLGGYPLEWARERWQMETQHAGHRA